MIDAYPLSWPAGWPRTPNHERRRPRFAKKGMVRSQLANSGWTNANLEINVEDGVKRVLDELSMLDVHRQTIIISTNVELRRDGLPRVDRANVGDPGVAVYWIDPTTAQQDCMAIDIYDTVAGNLAGVAATLGALRAIERHGGAQIMKRAFHGFEALPASTIAAMSVEQAAEALLRRLNQNGSAGKYTAAGIVADRTSAQSAVRAAAAKTHPDAGGSHADFQVVQEAKRVLEAHFGGAL